jgi:hypothetical protein
VLDILNNYLFQKFNLIEISKFNHYFNTHSHVWAETLFLIGDAQNVEYIIEMGDK